MNTKQTNKIRMVLATRAVLQGKRTVWNEHKAFSRAVGLLNDAIKEIRRATQKQVAKDGATETEEDARRLLGKTAYEVAGATYACATVSGNATLAARVDYGRREVLSGSQSAIQGRCNAILKAATEVPEVEGIDYGITPERLELLRERIDAFEVGQTQPREEQAATTAAGQTIVKSHARASEVLNGQLDRLVVQFEDAEPQFVAEYRSARRIINLRNTAAKSPVEPEKPGTHAPPASTPDAVAVKAA
jgi:hypothetical protein